MYMKDKTSMRWQVNINVIQIQVSISITKSNILLTETTLDDSLLLHSPTGASLMEC